MTQSLPPQQSAQNISIDRQICSPIYGPFVITGPWDPNRVLQGRPKPHYGTDLNYTVGGGDPLWAIGHGTVVEVTKDADGLDQGESVTIKFSDEFKSKFPQLGISKIIYMHMWPGTVDQAGLSVDDVVEAGQWIGRIGSTGISAGAHLHLQAYDDNGAKIDIESTDFFNQVADFKGQDSAGKSQFDGKLRKDGQGELSDQEAIDQISQLPQPQGQAGGVSNPGGVANFAKSDDAEIIDEEEIRIGVLPLLMDQIINQRRNPLGSGPNIPTFVAPEDKKNKNFITLNGGKNTAILPNLVLGRKFNKEINELKNSELANMVPYAELYNIRRTQDGQFIETPFYFDDYTQKIKLDSIFYDRTSRGGNIGLKSVEWRSLATNMSNQSFIEATIKIIIQDIQDIETTRNGVSLLDFLYPAGNTNPEFIPSSFNVKLKAGWIYRKENNSLLSEIDQKILEENLIEILYLTLTNHRFEFTEDGVCELTIDYKGMLETELENQNDYNVLDKLSPNNKKLERILNSWKEFLSLLTDSKLEKPREVFHFIEKLNSSSFKNIFEFTVKLDSDQIKELIKQNPDLTIDDLLNINKPYDFLENENGTIAIAISDDNANQTQEFFKVIQKYFTRGNNQYIYEIKSKKDARQFKKALAKAIDGIETTLRKSYLATLQSLLFKIDMNYISLTEKDVDFLKKITSVTHDLNQAEFESYQGEIKKFIENRDLFKSYKKLQNYTKRIGEAFKKNNIKESQKFIDTLFEGTRAKDNYMNIPYIFLGDIIEYYLSYFNKDEKSSILNSFLLVLGSFSYTNFSDSKYVRLISGMTSRTSPVTPKGEEFYKRFEKKYANLADIPISLDSFLSWYSSYIIDGNIKKLGFIDFIRSMFSSVVNSSLKNNIVSFAPQRSIIPSFNYITVDEEKAQKELSFTTNSRKSWIKNNTIDQFYIDFDFDTKKIENTLSNCPFYNIKKIVPDKSTNFNSSKSNKRQSFLIILSKNEKDLGLKSDYEEDRQRLIPHFYVGQDKGLIKEIKFSRQDNQKLESANILRANNNQSNAVLIRQIYNIDLKLFGNNLISPGSLIHITPTYPGTRLKNPTLYQIGLGGYYMVNEVSNIIEENNFETTIKGQWQMYGDGLEESNNLDNVFKVLKTPEQD